MTAPDPSGITYRSLLSFPDAPGEVFRALDEQLRTWLVSKDVPWQGGLVGASGNSTTRVEAFEHRERDQSRTNVVRVVDDTATGSWSVRLTAHAPSTGDPWLLTEVLSPQRDEGERAVAAAPPRLLRQLLEVVPARDGGMTATPAPVLIRADEVGSVVDAVLDPVRRGLVYVAGTPVDFPLDRWQQYIGRLVRDTVGLASAFVLDGEATAIARRQLGVHGPDVGYLRTYLRGVELGDTADATRHRFLTPRTMTQRPDYYIRRVLSGTARRQVVDRPVPAPVARVVRLAARWEAAEAAASTLPPTPTPQSPTVRPEQVDESVARAREAEARLARLQEQVDAYELELLRRDEQLEALQTDLDDAQLDAAAAVDEAQDKDDQVRYLRTRLMQLDQGAVAWSDVPDEDRTRLPESVSELLERLDELQYVVFTGDPEPALDLDVTDTLGRSARKAWQALLALEDYARLRAEGGFAGTVHDYCRETPGGCNGWSAERHSPVEAEQVRNNVRFSAARELPVPEAVDLSGRIFMGAHFKLAAHRTVSPRLHYYDDTANSGKVYVGYFGRHLPNTQTN